MRYRSPLRHRCSWTESGDACTRCMNKFYNAPDGTCLEDCVGVEGFPETLTHGGATGSGRACERPFTCANNVHSLTQGKCRCSDKKNCKSCEYRAGNGKLESFCKAVACSTVKILPRPLQPET